MERRNLGRTGVSVSVLGFGGAEIGFEREDTGDANIETLLNTLLDEGVNFIDTAECYAESETLVGQFIGHRRNEYVLATKVGHRVIEGVGDEWSVPLLEATVDRSLQRLRTDHVDIIHLHTPPMDRLRDGGIIDVLVRARDAGKTRFIGFSGDNEEAAYAVSLGVFDTLETSFSVLDQGARKGLIEAALQAGMGIVNKRPLANAMLGAPHPWSDYSRPYFERRQRMTIPAFEMDPIEASLRYALSFPVSTLITGTRNAAHMRKNVEYAAKGPLPADLVAAFNAAWDAAEEGWEQLS